MIEHLHTVLRVHQDKRALDLLHLISSVLKILMTYLHHPIMPPPPNLCQVSIIIARNIVSPGPLGASKTKVSIFLRVSAGISPSVSWIRLVLSPPQILHLVSVLKLNTLDHCSPSFLCTAIMLLTIYIYLQLFIY